VAGCGECGDEPSGSCATELVITHKPRRVSVAKLHQLEAVLRLRMGTGGPESRDGRS
jgi:hypothetical protein